MCGRLSLRKRNVAADVRWSGADMCPACSTRRAWPLALMRSADRVPINFARSKRRPFCGMSQSSVTTECSSASRHPRDQDCQSLVRGRLAIVLLPYHHRPRDPDHLVGGRQRHQPERTAIQQRPDLCRMPVRLAWQPAHDRGRADCQQAPKVSIALLGYPAQLLPAAARVLSRHQPDPCRQLAARLERRRVRDGGRDRRCGDRCAASSNASPITGERRDQTAALEPRRYPPQARPASRRLICARSPRGARRTLTELRRATYPQVLHHQLGHDRSALGTRPSVAH